jgi:hypothetical protein
MAKGRGVAQVVEGLPSKYKTLSSFRFKCFNVFDKNIKFYENLNVNKRVLGHFNVDGMGSNTSVHLCDS